MAYDRLSQGQVHDDRGRRKYVRTDEGRRFLDEAALLPAAYRCLCLVLFYTGCRVSEALSLCAHQIDAQAMTLTIKTLKRRRTVFRVVPVPKPLIRDLQALPRQIDGRLWTIHRATAWRIVKGLMGRCAIDGPMACCKGLRHGFGMKAASHHVPLPLIQRWMGHSTPSTTAIYVDAIGDEEREFAERMW